MAVVAVLVWAAVVAAAALAAEDVFLCQLQPFRDSPCDCHAACAVNNTAVCRSLVLCDGTDVVTLHLAGFMLPTLPESIDSLTRLSQLELMFNSLERLPTSFANLNSLYGINIGNNRLTSWEALTPLESVSLLYLNNNYFRGMPADWGKLARSLTLLDLGYNGVSQIPPSITQLQGLTYLTLDYNSFSQLPPEFSQLHSLIFFSIAGNKLTALPENFGALTNLKYLNLKNNRLSTLPESLISLTGISFLFLGGNPFDGKIDVSTVPSLFYLDAESMGITAVDKSILKAPNLRHLMLAGNRVEAKTDFSTITLLQTASLDSNQLDSVPLFPTSVTALSLKGNRFSSFPVVLTTYPNLATFNLGYNQLTSLPDIFDQFPALTSVNIESNSIRVFPESFFRLNLSELIMDGNCFDCEEMARKHPFTIFNASCRKSSQRNCKEGDLLNLILWPTVAAIVLVSVVVSAILYFRMRKAKRDLRALRRREAMLTTPLIGGHEGLQEFAGDDDVFGLTVSPKILMFGSSSSLVPLDTELVDQFTITGSRRKPKGRGRRTATWHFQIAIPDVPIAKCEVSASCPTDEVYPGESVVVNVKLKMLCTTTLSLPIFVIVGEAYTRALISVESHVSTRIDADEVTLGEVIGAGSFGTVFRGEWRGNSELAIKVYNNSALQDIGLKSDIEREVEMCFSLRMPFIVTFYGKTVQPDRLYIIMEYVPNGSLGSLLKKGPLSLRWKVRVALDVAKGMNYLHKNRVIHRDLKSDNILVAGLDPDAGAAVAKLSDFNTSRFWGSDANRTKTRGVGTPIFMAPEILDGKHYSWMADVYSFGIVLWNLWTQQEPYADFESALMLYKFVMEGNRLTLPEDGLPDALRRITEESWHQHPESRPSFATLVTTIGDIFSHMPR